MEEQKIVTVTDVFRFFGFKTVQELRSEWNALSDEEKAFFETEIAKIS